MEAVIGGKLNYLSMVKGTENSTYLKLKERFDKLSSNYLDVENILAVWEENGIDEAMDLYSKIV